jgi:hypothetical protein
VCLNSPKLESLLLGIGVSFTYLTIKSGEAIPLPFDPHVLLASISLVMGLAVVAVGTVAFSGQLGIPFGLMLVGVYICLIVGTIVIAVNPDGYSWLARLHD